MYLKKKLMKAASICSYVCSAIWFVAAASAFALSDYTYWLFLIFALLSLYGGFAVTSIREKMTGVILEKYRGAAFVHSERDRLFPQDRGRIGGHTPKRRAERGACARAGT